MLLTSQLVFTIFMLAAEKHEATFLAPVGIGLSAFIAELIGKVAVKQVKCDSKGLQASSGQAAPSIHLDLSLQLS